MIKYLENYQRLVVRIVLLDDLDYLWKFGPSGHKKKAYKTSELLNLLQFYEFYLYLFLKVRIPGVGYIP